MVRSRAMKVLVICVILGVIAIAGAVYLKTRPTDPVQQASDRAAARVQWLELVDLKGKEAFGGSVNAKLLASCFKEGDPAAECEKVLATSQWQENYPASGKGDEFDGALEYFWMFRVEKPRHPDETGYVLFVRVQGSPPMIRRVSGSLTVD